MHVIGTAGHVDHGKSTLVAALTGTNPDRWLEEQLRGMTLDLGFAHLRLDDGLEAGIVDVPGHERFLHNMLAGAAGMELLLLVVDAVEGPRTQTIEHLQILRYLNVQSVIVVATKIDLLDIADRTEALELIQQQLHGTIAQDAPMIAVSSTTGEGLPQLRAAIADALRALPQRPSDAPLVMPVDRAFALSGHGTILTGTLMQGSVRAGDQLKLMPSEFAVRVRRVQVFGQTRDCATAGSRVAVNVPNVSLSDVKRGDVLADPHFRASDTFAVSFTPLESALELLHRRNPVRAYIGSAEILGTLVFEHPPRQAAAANATLFLRRATAIYPGAAFIVRRMSPKTLLGGGKLELQSAALPHAQASHAAAILPVLHAAGSAGLALDEIAARVNLREDAATSSLDELVASGCVVDLKKPAGYATREAVDAVRDAVLTQVQSHQTHAPWTMGLTSLALARELSVDERQMIRALTVAVDEGTLGLRAGYYSTPGFVPKLTDEQNAFFEQLFAADPSAPFVPVDFAQIASAVKNSRVAGARAAFDTLLGRGALVKVGDALYRRSQISQVHARVESFLRKSGRMTMADFRDLLGTSRKYAVPLLEWFDARGITVRSGDFRMLRVKKVS